VDFIYVVDVEALVSSNAYRLNISAATLF